MGKSIFFRGEKAAKAFYDPEKIRRRGAAPKFVKKTLFGIGGVQGLGNKAHRHRKQMFMNLMNPESIDKLMGIIEKEPDAYLDKWQGMKTVVLFEELEEILFRAFASGRESLMKKAK